MSKNNKILFVGSLPNRRKNSIGGATSLFQNLIDYCTHKKVSFSILTANVFGLTFFSIPDFIRVVLWGFYKTIQAEIIMVNVSKRGIYTTAPYFVMLAKLFRRKVVVRAFGGSLDIELTKSTGIKRRLMLWVIRNADILFAETKILVQFLKEYNSNTQWLSNSREPQKAMIIRPAFSKKFAFIGQVKTSKGIDSILQVQKQLSSDYLIDIYGPIFEDKYNFLQKKTFYKGILEKKEVLPTLQQYDVLLLPTHYEGEGYPGVIIEAYSLGIPCVTTKWRAIQEIVDDKHTGFLISPQSASALQSAIIKFNTQNYSLMSIAAKEKFKDFNSDIVNANLIQLLERV